jgi:hypothetical protein
MKGGLVGRIKRRPEDERCRCTRPERTVRVVSYRSHSGSFRYHRCDCGTEWTERLTHVDRTRPVTGDELLDVHIALAEFEGKLTDLIDRSTAP